MKTQRFNRPGTAWCNLIVGMAIAIFAPLVHADTTIANAPLFTATSQPVKPNLMFILDDSGSMADNYIPDDALTNLSNYGMYASQCNGVAYNPAVQYALPLNAAGATVSNASTSAALNADPNTQLSKSNTLTTPTSFSLPATAGSAQTVTIVSNKTLSDSLYLVGQTVTLFSTASTSAYILGTVSSWSVVTTGSGGSRVSTGTLGVTVSYSVGSGTITGTANNNNNNNGPSLKVASGDPRPHYYTYSGSNKALDYTYTSGGVITTTNFYLECNSMEGASPGSGVFTRETVTAASADLQNYANWLAYYSTRILMAKSAIGLVFDTLDSKYRVGYSTISEESISETTGNQVNRNFLNIRDFDSTQKGKFFADLSSASPGNSTPLRAALSKAGRYYAKKMSGQTYDPMQYACQKNFTLLSTDGYWNTGDETSTYGPFAMDGLTNVGEVDGYPTTRPKFDGGSTNSTKTTTWSATQTIVTRDERTSTTYSQVTGTTTGSYSAVSGGNKNNVVTTYTNPTTKTNSSISVTTASCAATGNGKSSCKVVITTNVAHGAAAGDNILISGASGTNNSLFNKSFPVLGGADAPTATTYTILVTGFTTGTYTVPSSRGSSYFQGACTSNNYLFTGTSVQTDAYTLTLTDTRSALTTLTTDYSNTQQFVRTIPYSRVDTVVNGVVTVPGTAVRGTPVDGAKSTIASAASTSSTTGPTTVGTPTTSTSTYNKTTNTAVTKCANPLPGQTTANGTYISPAPTYSPTPIASPTAPNPPAATTSTGVQVSATPEVAGAENAPTYSNVTYSGGGSDSLADISYYYYNNDIRDLALWNNCSGGNSTDVCGTADKFLKQNMITMTLGLGASGLLAYDKNYISQKTVGSGDFFKIRNGDIGWPIPGDGKGPENIDDLWHAAVNATDFGTAAIPVTSPNTQYFSAGDPATLTSSLTNALANVRAVVGSSSAAATSTLQPVAGDNDVFVAKFTSVKWTGDVQRFSIDPSTGAISTSYSWSAAAQLDTRDLSTNARKIYYAQSGQSALRDFTYANLTADGFNGYFDNFCNKLIAGAGSTTPSQCGFFGSTSTTAANTGSNLVAYFLGSKSYNTYYRTRDSILGDVVNGAPLFVGPPKFKYTENNYATFASGTRQTKCSASTVAGSGTVQGTVYVGANDGMLHAFDRCDGTEKWAYVPKMVIPNMFKIADNAYNNNHQYFVDGAPVTGDIFVGGAWKTILVGGLNAGGRGYYALDITDPNSPKALWEYSNDNNANLGLTFGNPIITKRATDGKWVVVFGSGYNNNAANSSAATGDGIGRLFMLDANTGAEVLTIPTMSGTTAVGGTTTPSGLAKLNAWVETELDNTAQRYYGGDLLGNVWRFDTEDLIAPKKASFLLAQLRQQGSTTAQPVTVAPELAQVSSQGSNYAVVFVGTGEYLGSQDLNTTTDVQTIYAIKDALGSTPLGDIHATTSHMVKQALTTTGSIRTNTVKNPVDWSAKDGWYVDLPSAGERVNVNMVLAYNVLSVASTVPSVTACESGGTSWLYKLDIANGAAVSNATDNAAGLLLQEGTLIVGQTVVQLSDGSASTISTLSSGDLRSDNEAAPPMDSVLHRTSWRELAN
jgi:type IV pilus assembly protein PilY1